MVSIRWSNEDGITPIPNCVARGEGEAPDLQASLPYPGADPTSYPFHPPTILQQSTYALSRANLLDLSGRRIQKLGLSPKLVCVVPLAWRLVAPHYIFSHTAVLM